MKKAVLFLFIVSVFCNGAFAQTFTWSDIINGINETSGSRPECISILALDNNVVVGGTSFGIYHSVGNGGIWSLASSNYFTCQDIIQANSGKLVAVGRGIATIAGKSIQTSTNQGSSWTGVTPNANTTNIEFREIAKDVNNNLYTAGYSNSVSAAIGVYKSTDEGDTWTQLGNSGLPSGILYVDGIYTEDGNTILMGSNKGISKSIDGGATFTTGTGLNDYIYRIRKAPNGTILASSDDGIYASTDTGSTFSKVISTASIVFDFLLQNDTIVAAEYGTGVVLYNSSTYATLGSIGNSTNGLSSTRLRAISVNSNGQYFAASEGTNNTNGRKFHTTVGGLTGINGQPTNHRFSLYPNPANNNVTLSQLPAGATLSISNLAGQVLYSHTATTPTHTLSTLAFATGVYVVTLNHQGQVYTEKLVIGN